MCFLSSFVIQLNLHPKKRMGMELEIIKAAFRYFCAGIDASFVGKGNGMRYFYTSLHFILLSFRLLVYLLVCLPVRLLICLSLLYMSACLSVCLFVCLFVSTSVCLSVSLSVCSSVCLLPSLSISCLSALQLSDLCLFF